MKITISGTGGSGKSTVAKIVAKRLGYKYFSVGDFRGEIAKKHNMTIDELNTVGETEDWTDIEADQSQKEYGEKNKDFVVEGRMSYHFIPDSVKIFMDVDISVAAERIFKDQRDDEKKQDSVQGVEQMIREREECNKRRYKKWYDTDYLDSKHYDLFLDTSNLTVEEAAQKILDFLEKV